MKHFFFFSLLLQLFVSSPIYGQIQMDILDLKIVSLLDPSRDTTVINGDTLFKIRVGAVAMPTVQARIRLTNVSDSCFTLNIKEGSVIVSYNTDSMHQYRQELFTYTSIVNPVLLNKGDDVIFDAKGSLFGNSFLLNNEGKYVEFKDYSYITVQIIPTLKFIYTEEKSKLRIVHNEIANASISYK